METESFSFERPNESKLPGDAEPRPGTSEENDDRRLRLPPLLEYYPLLTAGEPPPPPARKISPAVIFALIPAALYPLFHLLRWQNFLSEQMAGLVRLRVSMEVAWILSAAVLTALFQAVAGRILVRKKLRGEGVWAGALIAPPLFGLLRGFGFATIESLAAATVFWVGLSATVVISEIIKAGGEEGPGRSEGEGTPAPRETAEAAATREIEETPATREGEEAPAPRKTEETPTPREPEELSATRETGELPAKETAGGDNKEKPSENTPGTGYPRRDSNARHQV